MEMDLSAFARHQKSGNTISEYLVYLKTVVPDPKSHQWIEFEESICSQAMELHVLKKKCETLRTALGKSQETQRELELQLVSEKSLRDQFDRQSKLAIDKSTVELKAQIYSMKYEVESWKQKAECTAMELQLLKEQIKTIEVEKCEALRNLNEIAETSNGYDTFRKSFDVLVGRIQDNITDLTKQLSQGTLAKEELTKLVEAYKHEINVLNIHVKNEKESKLYIETSNDELESNITALKTDSIRVKMDLISELNSNIAKTEELNSLKCENTHLKQQLASCEEISGAFHETREKILPDIEELLTSVRGKMAE